jgi:hypothetical protein
MLLTSICPIFIALRLIPRTSTGTLILLILAWLTEPEMNTPCSSSEPILIWAMGVAQIVIPNIPSRLNGSPRELAWPSNVMGAVVCISCARGRQLQLIQLHSWYHNVSVGVEILDSYLFYQRLRRLEVANGHRTKP